MGRVGSALVGLHLEGVQPGELFTVSQGYQEQVPHPHLSVWNSHRTWASTPEKDTDLEPEEWHSLVRGQQAPCSEGACEGPGRTRPQADAFLRGVGCRQHFQMQTTESTQAGLRRKAFIKG